MKKYIILAAAAIALAACNNDDNYVDEPVAAQISATIDQSAVSRASETSWAEGDMIGITMIGRYTNMKYTTEAGDGVFTGTTMYFKNKQEPVTITAYYPFRGPESSVPAPVEASTYSNLQTTKAQAGYDFLYAKLEDVTGANSNVNLQFSHMMSKLTFIFKNGDGADGIKISSYKIEGLVLDGTFDTATGQCTAKAVDPATLSINLNGETDGITLAPLIVFPQKPGTVTLKLHDSENQDYACDLNFGDKGLESGKNYQFTIKVSKTGLKVNPSITDWSLVEIKENHTAESDDSDDSENTENPENPEVSED